MPCPSTNTYTPSVLQFTSSVDSNESPTSEQFKESCVHSFVDTYQPSVQYNSGSPSKPRSFKEVNALGMSCEHCSEQHKLCFCKKFAREDVAARHDFVDKNSICTNCLGSNHKLPQCRNPGFCRICKEEKKHHSLLHNFESTAISSAAEEPIKSTSIGSSAPPIVSCLSTQRISSSSQVLLPKASVKTESEAGGDYILRVLVDQGSQSCFISEAAVQLLSLKKTPVRGIVTGLREDKAITSKYVVNIKLRSKINKNINLEITAYVLKNITTVLRERQINKMVWIELQNLHQVDPYFDTPNDIRMLLGTNIYSQIFQRGIKKSQNGNLIAQRTNLDWNISGTFNEGIKRNSVGTPIISVMHAQVTEIKYLKQFRKIKYSTKYIWIQEDQKFKSVQQSISTTKRTDEDHRNLKLLFRKKQLGCLDGKLRQPIKIYQVVKKAYQRL